MGKLQCCGEGYATRRDRARWMRNARRKGRPIPKKKLEERRSEGKKEREIRTTPPSVCQSRVSVKAEKKKSRVKMDFYYLDLAFPMARFIGPVV